MAKLVYGLNQSLDGYVNHDHEAFVMSPKLFRFYTDELERQAGSIYGSKMYGMMSYWDGEKPEWGPAEQAYAAAWQKMPKWVVSKSLTSVGPNATLVSGDLESEIRALKAEREGEFEVAGTQLAQSLTDLGLIDEYHIFLHPVVLGQGTPFFSGARSRLRLLSHDLIDTDILRLIYVPA